MQTRLSQILSSLESGGRPKGGASLDNDGIPSLGAEHLDGNGGFNFKSVKYIPEDFFKGLKSGIIERENILIVKDGATTGKVSFVSDEFPFDKAAVNEHVFLLKIDKSKAYPRFAFHYLKCPQGQREIMRDFRGSTVGGISRGFVEFVKFELPCLPDQLHIANLLSKAERLMAQRKESIRLLDEFLKSTFLEMFGSGKTNIKGFPIVMIEDISKEIKDGPHVSPKYSETGIPIFSSRNIKPGALVVEEVKYVSEEMYHELTKRFKPQRNDILVTKGGTTGYAKVVDFDYPFCIWVHIAAIRTNNKIIPLYLEHYINSDYGYYQTQKNTKGAANRDLGLKKIAKIELPLPPIELQTQFAQIVEKTEALKSQYQQSLQELENLYGSMSQRAFRGEMSGVLFEKDEN